VTGSQQLQLPKPSVAWTVPPDLGPDETRWAWNAIIPGSERSVPGRYESIVIKMIGWVRGPKGADA
jgi:hypothetical protein